MGYTQLIGPIFSDAVELVGGRERGSPPSCRDVMLVNPARTAHDRA